MVPRKQPGVAPNQNQTKKPTKNFHLMTAAFFSAFLEAPQVLLAGRAVLLQLEL